MNKQITIHFDDVLTPINSLKINNIDKELYIGYEYNTNIINLEKELRSVKYIIDDLTLPYSNREEIYLIDTTLLLPKNIYPQSCISCRKKLENSNIVWTNNLFE